MILSHRYEDGSERPIAFASKLIPKQKLHRTIIGKEAAAIVVGFRKFYQYVNGAHIILRTDNEPLKFIFREKKNLSVMLQSQLIRWAYFLSGFTYKIEVVKSKPNGNCDALSRLPIQDKSLVFEEDFTIINYVEINMRSVDFKVLARETIKDPILSRTIKFLRQGSPKNPEFKNDVEKNLFKKRLELSVEDNCLLWGFRVVIPESLRKAVLSLLRASHMGEIKIKQLARNYFW